MKSKMIPLLVVVLVVLVTGCTSTQTTTINQPSNFKEFNINISQSGFSPNTITVNQGDHVTINLFDFDDMDHGFALATYNIEEIIQPGQKKTVKFITSVPGDLNFYCYVNCGENFVETRGKLVVLP